MLSDTEKNMALSLVKLMLVDQQTEIVASMLIHSGASKSAAILYTLPKNALTDVEKGVVARIRAEDAGLDFYPVVIEIDECAIPVGFQIVIGCIGVSVLAYIDFDNKEWVETFLKTKAIKFFLMLENDDPDKDAVEMVYSFYGRLDDEGERLFGEGLALAQTLDREFLRDVAQQAFVIMEQRCQEMYQDFLRG